MLIYSNISTKNTIFEVWGGSTKHPDVRRVLSYDIEENRFTPSACITTEEYKVFQWVVQCISELNFGTYNLLEDWMETCKPYFENRPRIF